MASPPNSGPPVPLSQSEEDRSELDLAHLAATLSATLAELIRATNAAELLVHRVHGEEGSPGQGLVTFDDVFLNFTAEEWELLTVDQRRLYYEVMSEIYMMMLSVGIPVSRHAALVNELERLLRILARHVGVAHSENMPPPPRVDAPQAGAGLAQEMPGPSHAQRVESSAAPLEQSIPATASRAAPPTQQCSPCDRCDPNLHRILHLAGQQPTPCQSCGRAFQVTVNLGQVSLPQNQEEAPKVEEGQASSGVSNRRESAESSRENRATSGGGRRRRATPSQENPPQSAQSKVALHSSLTNFKCDECGMVFPERAQLVEHQKSHSEGFRQSGSKRTGLRKSARVEEQKRLAAEKAANERAEEQKRLAAAKAANEAGQCLAHSTPPGPKSKKVRIPYVCPQCGKAYVTEGNYRNHRKIHIL